MPHRSISLLVLMGLVALLTGGVLTALNKPQVGIDAGSLFAPVVEVSKVGPVGQAESSAADVPVLAVARKAKTTIGRSFALAAACAI